jgi:hypothetical protein
MCPRDYGCDLGLYWCSRDCIDVPHGVSMCPRDCIDVAQGCIDVSQGLYRCVPGTVLMWPRRWTSGGAAVNVVMNLLFPLLASQGPRCLLLVISDIYDEPSYQLRRISTIVLSEKCCHCQCCHTAVCCPPGSVASYCCCSCCQ